MISFEIRAAIPGDEEQLLAVARHLNSVNLPNDRDAIHEIVEMSHRSYSGAIENPRLRQYVFVLVDVSEGTPPGGTIIGTSMLISQLGRRDAPYIYFDVLDEERYSATIDKHYHHTVLRIGYSYNGPTEIGGLVLMPSYRQRPEKLGTMISYVRFLYLAAHRDLFQDEILAELLPPLEPDGTSHLWEALGHKFVDLSYAEADRLSKKNKEFIKGLFPEGTIYASLLPENAQRVIGKTGMQTRGVEKLLRRIGFRYAHRVDPFDGGPHYTARMDEITLIQETRHGRVTHSFAPTPADRQALIATEQPEAPYFRAVLAAYRADGAGGLAIAKEAWEHLHLQPAAPVVILPIP
ncbi:arginine N-succinyltransferase [Chondromyces crocatus]|uniref:Arginine N-succinyltransferase n=1 Tax=Chondromyces crocatus TaxID=52 RepID=A0A0K1EN53_CHOCO|nr:arginine N-succinyltransferase [Chondromyces crocatus]AKT42335.1 arginine N-succinyltransferase [Chondromyces crocatus]